MKYCLLTLLVVIILGGAAYWFNKTLPSSSSFAKPDYLSQFNLSEEQIASDLQGHTVSLLFGQVWPFEANQGIAITVVGKKQAEEYVVVAVSVEATAAVEQSKEKDDKNKPPKLPSKVNLKGLMKVTYEKIGQKWFIVGVDGISLSAKTSN